MKKLILLILLFLGTTLLACVSKNAVEETEIYDDIPAIIIGLTSANVRLQFVYNESNLRFLAPYKLFDLSKVEHYYEFVTGRGLIQIVFTTEMTIHNFRFLSLTFDDTVYEEYVQHKNRYIVSEILYSFDRLIPGIPFVVTGANMGSSALAGQGFSFIDYNDITRYFAFNVSGYEGDDHPINIVEFFP